MAADQEILVENDALSMDNQQVDVALPSYESIIRNGNTRTRAAFGKITISHILVAIHFY